MTLLVEGQALLQGFVHDDLHPIVHGRADRDPSLEEILDPEAAGALLFHLVQDGIDRCGRVGLDRAGSRHKDRLGLAALRESLGDVPVAGHQGQDLIAAAQRLRVAGQRAVVPGRLRDPRQQRGFSRVLHGVARQGLAEVVLRAGGKTVATVPQVVEVGGAGEDLALRPLLRSVAPAHLLLEPESEADFLELPQELVRGRAAQDRGEKPRRHTVAEEGGAVLVAHTVPEEVTANELLRKRRAPLRETQPQLEAVLPPGGHRVHGRLVAHPEQRPVLYAGVKEKVLVFGRQDGVAKNGRHLVVGDDLAVLPCQLNQHLAVGVVDLADRGKLETDERIEVRQLAPVEVDVLDESPRGEQEQKYQGGSRDAHGAARACQPQNARHKVARGALVLPPSCAASRSPGSVSRRVMSSKRPCHSRSGLRGVVSGSLTDRDSRRL